MSKGSSPEFQSQRRSLEGFLLAGLAFLIPAFLALGWSSYRFHEALIDYDDSLKAHSQLYKIKLLSKEMVLAKLDEKDRKVDLMNSALPELKEEILQRISELKDYYRAHGQKVSHLSRLEAQLQKLAQTNQGSIEIPALDKFQRLVEDFDVDEIVQQRLKQEELADQRLLMIALVAIIGVIGVGLSIFGSGRYRSEFSRRQRLEEDLLESEARALHASKIKSRFLATISHELRTPLNGMLAMTDVLRRKPMSSEMRGSLDVIHQSGQVLLRLINEILDFSKIESGRAQLEVAPFDLKKLIQGIHSTLLEKAKQKGLRFELEWDPSLPEWFRGDSGRISQIIFNLVGNAIKFTKEGEVILSVRPIEGPQLQSCRRIRFEVLDTGCGIGRDQQSFLFQPFYQIESTSPEPGTGLGLSISQSYARLMQSSIQFESEAGLGSKFWLELNLEMVFRPQEQGPNLAEGQAPPPRLMQDKLPPYLRILVAEDNPTNQLVTRLQLEEIGIKNVTIASNGQEAYQMLQSQKFDLVLMDCQMPVWDGLFASKMIREHLTKDLPIIAITANGFSEDHEACLQAGMSDVLVKPARIVDLAEMVRKWSKKKDVSQFEFDSLDKLNDQLGSEATQEIVDSFLEELATLPQRINEDPKRLGHRIRSPSKLVGAHKLAQAAWSMETDPTEANVTAFFKQAEETQQKLLHWKSETWRNLHSSPISL